MMKLMIKMMELLPRGMKEKLPAPMLGKERMEAGSRHPTIKMNMANLLICARNCGTCPSFPNVKGEALFCAGGKSSATVERKGCNCVSCPIYDLCNVYNSAYFCINGSCGTKDTGVNAKGLADLSGKYLERFVHFDDVPAENQFGTRQAELQKITKERGRTADIVLDFIGDKLVNTNSDTPFLQASLSAGINHTHICGGRARCSTCRVLVSEGLENIRPRNEKEARLAAIKGFSPEVRLACQSRAIGDVKLKRLVLDDDDISQAIHEGRTGINIVGQEVDTTILFADIRSFTAFSEKSLPYDIVHILNRYFDAIGDAIDRNGGYIDKYMGDGIMTTFGLEQGRKEPHALLAMYAAKAMIQAVNDFNAYLKKRYSHEFRIGIGVHTGPVIVGELGFRKKKEFTAIGDTVNTASRIESLNKLAGTTVLVSESTYLLVKEQFRWRKGYSAPVKGKELPVKVFEPDL